MAALSPFELFGLKPGFNLDPAALKAAYDRVIVQVHPDRFADRSAAEKRVAEQWTVRINEAFDLLSDPVKRASWLCEAAGSPIGAETHTRMPADFLLEQMTWREALEEAQAKHSAQEKALVRARAEAARDELIAKLSDAIDGSKDWQQAADLTRRLMFVERFLEEAAD